MAEPSRPPPHRPGAVSLFFVAKAAVFAAGCWIWLLVLTVGGGEVHGLHILAATGALATTMAAVVLGIRLALQRDAATRHAELKRLLVDISWNAFAAAGNAESTGTVLPFPTLSPDPERVPGLDRGGSGAGRGGNGDRFR